MIKLEFKIPQLSQISHDIMVLKSCPNLPYDSALKLHSNIFGIDTKLKEHQGKLEVLREQQIEFNKKKNTDAKKIEYAEGVEKKVGELESQLISVDIDMLSAEELSGVKIEGEKEIPLNTGHISRHSYRDSFFNLLFFGIIERPVSTPN